MDFLGVLRDAPTVFPSRFAPSGGSQISLEPPLVVPRKNEIEAWCCRNSPAAVPGRSERVPDKCVRCGLESAPPTSARRRRAWANRCPSRYGSLRSRTVDGNQNLQSYFDLSIEYVANANSGLSLPAMSSPCTISFFWGGGFALIIGT